MIAIIFTKTIDLLTSSFKIEGKNLLNITAINKTKMVEWKIGYKPKRHSQMTKRL